MNKFVIYSRHLKGEIMAKSLMANMIKNKHARIKADAQKNKNIVAKNKTAIKQSQSVEEVVEDIAVMKEPKTLMLD